MSYRVEHVDRLPEHLEEEIVYISEEYEVAALKCACGCGHKVTLLLGDGHEVREIEERADIWPSIGVWDAPCRSHFFIRNGQIRWADRWSEERIREAMESQLARHLSTESARPWYKRLWTWIARLRRGHR